MSILVKCIQILQITLKLLYRSIIHICCLLKHIGDSEVAVAQNPVLYYKPHVPSFKISS